MTINLYNNKSDKRKINKLLETVQTGLSVEPLMPFDILNPNFKLTYTSNFLTAVNYLYCTETNRYYYCTITLDKGNVAYLSCSVDPLYSHRTQIMAMSCFVERTGDESKWWKNNIDMQVPTTPEINNRYIVFEQRLLNAEEYTNCVLLTMAGSRADEPT